MDPVSPRVLLVTWVYKCVSCRLTLHMTGMKERSDFPVCALRSNTYGSSANGEEIRKLYPAGCRMKLFSWKSSDHLCLSPVKPSSSILLHYTQPRNNYWDPDVKPLLENQNHADFTGGGITYCLGNSSVSFLIFLDNR